MANTEIVEGYGCSCGFTTDNRKKFLSHIGHMQAKEGRENHQSIGKINLLTGDVIMPPFKDRTPDQIYETKYHKSRPAVPFGPSLESLSKKDVTVKTVVGTPMLEQATQVRFVPRIFTCNLTPILLLGYEVAIQKWGWRRDMPFENYLETVVHNYFYEHGTKLQAAVTMYDDDGEQELKSMEAVQ